MSKMRLTGFGVKRGKYMVIHISQAQEVYKRYFGPFEVAKDGEKFSFDQLLLWST